MSIYTEAEAQQRFDELIDRALGGEHVVIARDGYPIVELNVHSTPLPVPAPAPASDRIG